MVTIVKRRSKLSQCAKCSMTYQIWRSCRLLCTISGYLTAVQKDSELRIVLRFLKLCWLRNKSFAVGGYCSGSRASRGGMWIGFVCERTSANEGPNGTHKDTAKVFFKE